MAVEARHLNLFPSQLIPNNRDLISPEQGNALAYNYSNGQMGSVPLLNSMNPVSGSFLPVNQSLVCDSIQAKTSMKSDSGLTYNLPAPRKRQRDSSEILSVPQKSSDSFAHFPSFLGNEIYLQMQQHQIEVDRLIAQHTKKIKLELEERQRQQARLLVSAIGEGIMKKLKEKDDQIQRIGKWNLVLQERVKSLCVENQLWRDLAQTNEATANSLRTNLEQVLAHVADDRRFRGPAAGGPDDIESCCGSNDIVKEHTNDDDEVVGPSSGNRTLAGEAQDREAAAVGGGRMCRRCGARESSVLLLPCRHVCLCAQCGSTLLHNCPVCNSSMNATVHINMS